MIDFEQSLILCMGFVYRNELHTSKVSWRMDY
jgi:hypothetical protein